MEVENQNYEFAFHINPDIEESDVKAKVEELQSFITANNGRILSLHEAKKKHLSFPIRQKHYAYFGYFAFSTSPEAIEKFNAQMKLENQVIRYLLTKQELDDEKLKVLGSERRARIRTHEPTVLSREEVRRAEKGGDEVKPEQIEKEIEDVLEKI